MKTENPVRKLILLSVLAITVPTFFAFDSTEDQKTNKKVEISDFEAYMIDDVAFVTWMATSEVHDEEVMLEKSTNGHKFVAVQKFNLNGAGSKYTFVDESPSYGLSYYRIHHKHHKPLENVAHLMNHDGPIHFEISAKNKVIELKADHKSDKTYLVSVADKEGKNYFLQSMTFTSTKPVKIDMRKLGVKGHEYIVNLHSTEWSTDKMISL